MSIERPYVPLDTGQTETETANDESTSTSTDVSDTNQTGISGKSSDGHCPICGEAMPVKPCLRGEH